MRRLRYTPEQMAVIEKKFISFSAIGLFLATLVVLFSMLYMNMLRGYTNDFRAFYTGALMVRHGQTHELYSFVRQYHWQQSFNPLLQRQTYTLLFMNPPFVALFLEPFTFMPEHTSYLIWGIINLGFLSVICYIVFRLFPHVRWQLRYGALAMILLFVPVCEALAEGQFSILLTLVLLVAWVFLRNNKQVAAGVALAFLIIKPQLIFLPGLIILWKYPKAFIAMFCTLLLFLGISLQMGGVALVSQYFHFLLQIPHWENVYGIFPIQQNSWVGIVSILIPREWHELWIASLFAGDGIVVGLLLWSFYRSTKDKLLFDLRYGMLLLVTVFTSMHVGLHDLSILVIPLTISGLYATFPDPIPYKQIAGILPFIAYSIIFIDFICMLCNIYPHLSTLFILFMIGFFGYLIFQKQQMLKKKK